MGLRDRRDDRQEFGRGGSAVHYKIQEKMFSIGDDFWIEDDNGNKAFKVNGKVARVRDTLDIEDPSGRTVVSLKGKLVDVRQTMNLEFADGRKAFVRKDLVNIVRDSFVLEVEGGAKYEVKGNILDHEYEISLNGDKVAEASKKWFRVRDCYGVEVSQNADAALMIATVVAVDQLSHDVA